MDFQTHLIWRHCAICNLSQKPRLQLGVSAQEDPLPEASIGPAEIQLQTGLGPGCDSPGHNPYHVGLQLSVLCLSADTDGPGLFAVYLDSNYDHGYVST